MLKLNAFYTLPDLFALVKTKCERDVDYSIYWLDNAPDPTLQDRVFVAAPVDVDDEDNEAFPQIVNDNGFWYFCSDENIQDVIDVAIDQKPNASDEEQLKCLDYYLKRDTFLDLA
ncbi:MAG: hypothetical protein H7Z20_00475 [Bdellovibrio sp.]|nr:hypothetical protein [Methylotenera sp.]